MGKKGKQTKKIDSDDSIDDEGSIGWNSDEDQIFYNGKDDDYDDYDDEEGGILLSDLIGLNEAKQKAKVAGVSSNNKASSKKQPVVAQQPKSKPAKYSKEEEEDSEIEENHEDEDSDGFLDASSDERDEDDSEAGSDMEEDEDEEDEDDDISESRHSKLLNAINRFSNVDEDAQRQKRLQQHYANLSESAVVGSNAMGSGLGLSSLFTHIGDAAGFAAVKTQLKDLEKPSAAPKYIEKVVANRMEREETYAANKEDITKWQETVIHNRSVSTLDLAQDKRRPHKAKTLVNTFVPTTDFEKEIQMVMLQHGATDEATEKKERELLDSSRFSQEEIAQKHAELAKVRALLFYEQMKRHRMNKIKSKAYRAIKRKERQRLEMQAEEMAQEMDDDDDGEGGSKEEKLALQRIKERMNLKHKNTSKWARMALKFGHADKSLRDAYHESVRMGQDLTRKIHEDVNAHSDDGSGMGDDSEYQEGRESDGDEEENNNNQQGSRRSIVAQAKRDMQQALIGDSLSEKYTQGKYKKLFEMDFMKKAVDVQKERAKEEARDVLKELATLETAGQSDSDYDGNHQMDSDEETREKHAQMFLASAPIITKKSAVTVVKNAASVNLAPANVDGQSKKNETVSDETKAVSFSTVAEKKKQVAAVAPMVPEAANPWLEDDVARTNSGRSGSGNASSHKKNKQSKTEEIAIATTISAPVSLSHPNTDHKSKKSSNNNNNESKNNQKNNSKKDSKVVTGQRDRSDSVVSHTEKDNSSSNNQNHSQEVKKTKKQLIEQSQEELVRMAFAGPNYEEDFKQQKDQEISRELGINDKKMKVIKDVKAGWGDWAGPGSNGMLSDKIQAKRDKLLLQIQREHDTLKLQRQDAKKTNVMISEKRVKAQARYKLSEVPHPFSSMEEYERSLRMPLGQEWNASHVVTRLTQPEVKKRAGRIIEPIAQPMKKKAKTQ